MEKSILMIICAATLLMAPVWGRRHSNDNDGFGCCFVDMFCYTTCFGDGGFNMMALVEKARQSGLHTSDSRRHRHRHNHRHRHADISSFRVKRQAADNVLWQKLRHGFQIENPAKILKVEDPET